MKKKLLSVFGFVGLAVILAGCTSAPSTPEPSPTSSASTTPPANVAVDDFELAKIVLRGDSFELRNASDEEITSFAYARSPEEVITSLTEKIGTEPVVTDHPADGCHVASKGYAWDDMMIGFAGDDPVTADKFTLTISSAKTPVPVEAVKGVAVGDKYETVEERLPDALTQIYQDSNTNTEYRWFVAEKSIDQSGIPADAEDERGSIVLAENGTVTSLYSGTVFSYC